MLRLCPRPSLSKWSTWQLGLDKWAHPKKRTELIPALVPMPRCDAVASQSPLSLYNPTMLTSLWRPFFQPDVIEGEGLTFEQIGSRRTRNKDRSPRVRAGITSHSSFASFDEGISYTELAFHLKCRYRTVSSDLTYTLAYTPGKKSCDPCLATCLVQACTNSGPERTCIKNPRNIYIELSHSPQPCVHSSCPDITPFGRLCWH